MSMKPSPGVSRMFPTTPGAAGGAGVTGGSVGATVNVQVAAWSASATALPAAPGESNTTSGHSKVRPAHAWGHVSNDAQVLEAGGQFVPIPRRQAHADGQQRERRAIVEQPLVRLGQPRGSARLRRHDGRR